MASKSLGRQNVLQKHNRCVSGRPPSLRSKSLGFCVTLYLRSRNFLPVSSEGLFFTVLKREKRKSCYTVLKE